MRIMMLALAAAGVVATAVPASAQYYYGGGGPSVSFSVGSGYGGGYNRGYDRGYGYRHEGRRDWGQQRYSYGPRYGAYAGSRGGCVVTVRRERWDGTVVLRRINRC